jgi:putative tryptophan/tyrosine transport system substrate-binding protein
VGWRCAWAFAGVGLAVVATYVIRSQPTSPPLILYTGAQPKAEDKGFALFESALRERLRARGMEAKIEHHWARPEPTPMVTDMQAAFRRGPQVLIAPSGDHATVAMRERLARGLESRVPIVFASYPDPVRRGIVRSLDRPGGLTTGVSVHDTWHAKRIELLRDAFPSIRTLGVLLDRSYTTYTDFERELALPAQRFGIVTKGFIADNAGELDRVMRSAAAAQVDSWYIPPTWIAYAEERAVLGHLRRLGRPAMHVTDGEVERGALMAYEQQTRFAYAAMADLTLRILRGEDAGNIPVQRPWRFTLSVRPRDEPEALRIDPSVIRRADRIH